MIRAVPGFFSRFAIDSTGTNDKPLLVGTTIGLTVVLGAWVGAAARRRPVIGPVAFFAFGGLAVACAASLHSVSVGGATIAALAAAFAGSLSLNLLLAVLAAEGARPSAPGSEPGPASPEPAVGRRRFLAAAGIAAGSTAVGLVAARQLGRPSIAAGQRARVRLPPAKAANEVAVADEDHVAGISRLVTPNADFYRIDEALVVPSVDVRTWRLRVGGMVDAPFELTYDELLAEPQIERPVTLACVSNEVGGRLVGTARWTGVRLGDLLARAGVHPGATQVVGRSVDKFTVGFPIEAALDSRDALVALGMNGEPLPLDHGFPARLIVPGLYGYVSATKWLREVELTTWDAFDAYWVERGWDDRAPIKVQSRVDVPRDYSRVSAGRVAVAGVAWAPRHGIAAVEVRVDGGPWQPTRLGPSLGQDVWRQWVYDWDAPLGSHVIEVRATTEDGDVQPKEKHAAFPNGATGHHEAHVRVVS